MAVASLRYRQSTPPAVSTLSLHDALPISVKQTNAPNIDRLLSDRDLASTDIDIGIAERSRDLLEREVVGRSEEHTSELQSRRELVCRLLLEKKNGGGVGEEQAIDAAPGRE